MFVCVREREKEKEKIANRKGMRCLVTAHPFLLAPNNDCNDGNFKPEKRGTR